jgi:hypothetical protein
MVELETQMELRDPGLRFEVLLFGISCARSGCQNAESDHHDGLSSAVLAFNWALKLSLTGARVRHVGVQLRAPVWILLSLSVCEKVLGWFWGSTAAISCDNDAQDFITRIQAS